MQHSSYKTDRERPLGSRRTSDPRPLQQKRQRVDLSLPLKKLLISLQHDTMDQAQTISMEMSKISDGDFIFISTLLACVQNFPLKTSTYAVLMGKLCHLGKQESVLNTLIESIKLLGSAVTRKERLLIRFLGACFKSCGIPMEAYYTFIVEPLLLKGAMTPAGEMNLLAVLSALPWISCSSAASRNTVEEDAYCRAQLTKIQSMNFDRVAFLSNAALSQAQQNRLDPCCDRIAMGLSMLHSGDCHDEEFDALLIANAPQLISFAALDFDRLVDALQEWTPTSGGSTNEQVVHLPLFPEGDDSLGDDVMEISRKSRVVDRFLVRENVSDILGSYYAKVPEAADAICSLHAPRQSVETCFSHLLAMPQPEHPPLFYAYVLVAMCGKQPDIIPMAIEDAMDMLLLKLEPEYLDLDVLDRLCLWFVHHLVTFDLDFPWFKWERPDMLSPSTQTFVNHTLERLGLQYNHPSNVANPEQLNVFELMQTVNMPGRFQSRVKPLLGRNVVDSSLVSQDSPIAEFVQTKPNDSELVHYISTLLEGTEVEKIRILVHCAMLLGSQSFYHTKKALERIRPGLLFLVSNDPDLCLVVFNSTSECCVSDQSWLAFSLDVLLDCRVGSVSQLLTWSVGQEDAVLTGYFKRRLMENCLARADLCGERNSVIEAVLGSADLDEAMDLWLSRRKQPVFSEEENMIAE